MKHKPLIAVVDDDQSIREALENLISSVGFEVKLFASAEEYLDSDTPSQTDCAILDVRLPGITGLELQQRLVAEEQSIPVIVITAQGDDKTHDEAVAAGAIAFLKKPVTEAALLTAVESALNRNADEQIVT